MEAGPDLTGNNKEGDPKVKDRLKGHLSFL